MIGYHIKQTEREYADIKIFYTEQEGIAATPEDWLQDLDPGSEDGEERVLKDGSIVAWDAEFGAWYELDTQQDLTTAKLIQNALTEQDFAAQAATFAKERPEAYMEHNQETGQFILNLRLFTEDVSYQEGTRSAHDSRHLLDDLLMLGILDEQAVSDIQSKIGLKPTS